MNTFYDKGILPLLFTVFLGTGLTACDSDLTDTTDGTAQEVKLNIITRNGESTPWSLGNDIRIDAYSAIDIDQPSQTCTYIYQNNGSWTAQNDGKLLWSIYGESLNFIGWAPSTAGTTFTLPKNDTSEYNQSSDALLYAADLMTTDKILQSNTNSQAVDFSFQHRLCKVTFQIETYGTEFGSTLPNIDEVRILSQNSGVELDYANSQDGTPAVTVQGSAISIIPLATIVPTTHLNTYTAIVTPCALTSGSTVIMNLMVNDKLLAVKYSGNLEKLESGKAYSFKLKVGKDVVTIESSGISINGWNTEVTGSNTYEQSYYVRPNTHTIIANKAGVLTSDIISKAMDGGTVLNVSGTLNGSDLAKLATTSSLTILSLANTAYEETIIPTTDWSTCTNLKAIFISKDKATECESNWSNLVGALYYPGRDLQHTIADNLNGGGYTNPLACKVITANDANSPVTIVWTEKLDDTYSAWGGFSSNRTFSEAKINCETAGGRLPSYDELKVIAEEIDMNGYGFWLWINDSNKACSYGSSGLDSTGITDISSGARYFCVFDITL
jgi:hypothetical protein